MENLILSHDQDQVIGKCTYHDRLSIVRKIMNESNASIVGVLFRPPGFRPTEETAARTIHQSEMHPLIVKMLLSRVHCLKRDRIDF